MSDATGMTERDGVDVPKGALAQEQLRETIGLALVPFRWDLLGFGLSRAQATALLAFAANEIWISGASLAVQEVVFMLAAATALAIAMFAKRRADLAAPVGAVVAFLTVGVLGMVSIMIGKFDGSGVLLVAGFSLAGASAGFFETAWGPKFVRLSQAGIQLYTLFGMAVSSLFGIMLSFLPGNGFYLASLTLLGVQAVLLLVRRRADEAAGEGGGSEASLPSTGAAAVTASGLTPADRVAQRDRGPARTVLAILATTLAFSLIYNMFITLAYSSLPSDAASQIRFWANLLAACVIICSFLLLRPVRPATLFHLVLPVVTLGFVLFLLSPGLLGEGALMASSIGRKFFDIFVWIIVAEAASLPSIGAWRSFGLLTAAKNLGYGVGLLGAHAGGGYRGGAHFGACGAAVVALPRAHAQPPVPYGSRRARCRRRCARIRIGLRGQHRSCGRARALDSARVRGDGSSGSRTQHSRNCREAVHFEGHGAYPCDSRVPEAGRASPARADRADRTRENKERFPCSNR